MKPMLAGRVDDSQLHLQPHMPAASHVLAAIAALALLLALGASPTFAASTTYHNSCGEGGRTDDGPPSKTAHIGLSRSSGAAGTLIAASGTGWQAGDEVTLRVEYADPAQGDYSDTNGPLVIETVAPDGSFPSAMFRLPPGPCNAPPPPGSRARVVAQEFSSGQLVTAFVPLTIVAAPQMYLVAVPGSGQVTSGEKLPVVGTGWGAGTIVTLTLGRWSATIGGRPTLVEPLPNATSVQVRADNTGAFDASVPISSQIRWGATAQVMASATTTQLGDLAILSTIAAAMLTRALRWLAPTGGRAIH
jgi:hypothetical protein